MRILSGQFNIAKWEEQMLVERPEPAKLNEAHIEYKLEGDMEGSLKGKYLMSYENDEAATYTGILIFDGKIGAKSGQFAIKENGVFENGVAKTNWEIIAQSGTNQFAHINGQGGYAATGSTVDYKLEVTEA